MDCPDRADDRTFRVNFSAEGISSLREKVKEKLKEYMGDYTDDTLVEYVIVLLRNGRRKEEARNELNVFLGDDSASFISWLWDHLASNVNSYVQVPVHPDEVINHKSKHQKQMETGHVDSESEMAEPSKYARSRHNREWKGLIRDADEPLLLRSSNIDNNESGEKNHHKSNYENRSLARSKRNRLDDRHQPKRQSISQATIDAPRRLLQFAVRDAVGTSKSFSLAKELTSEEEPKLKRLRSVVSTPVGEPSVNDQPRRIKSVARVPNATAVAIKAVAEAAEDVGKVGSSRNVFDRLGRAIDVSDASEQLLELKGVRNNDNDRINYILGEPQTCYNDTELVDDTTMLDHTMPLASDYLCNNEGYVSGIMGLMDGSEMTTSGRKKEGASIMQRDLANITYGVVQKSRNKDLDRAVAAENMGHKMGYVPVNVDAWKLPHCRVSMEVSEIDRRKSLQQSGVGTGKLGAPPVKENSNTVAVSNGNAKSVATIQKESQGTLTSPPSIPSTCRPLEDADLRTIFLNNVHFAATKDSLSRHFNKFGEVLKVVIVTDATTGQPKGSAFVEFMRKEAADGALTLDGTSFMSRILKIARKGCTQQESGPSIVAWPRVHRGAPFSLSRFPGIPFPRGGVPGRGFRPRPPVKVGARSMQWKRDGQPAPESGSAVSGNSLCLPAGRSLTYVRKTDGSS